MDVWVPDATRVKRRHSCDGGDMRSGYKPSCIRFGKKLNTRHCYMMRSEPARLVLSTFYIRSIKVKPESCFDLHLILGS
jgi:hypothetical protein